MIFVNEEKFLKVESIEFLHDDVEFGGNYGIFKVILEECEELKKPELVNSMNKIILVCTINKSVAETFKKLKIINKRLIPKKYLKED